MNILTSEVEDRLAAASMAARVASAQARDRLDAGKEKTLLSDVENICVLARVDLTAREIQVRIEAQKSMEQGRDVRVDMSTLASVVNRLVTAGRLLRQEAKRECTVTGNMVTTLYPAPLQRRIAGEF